jgi:hypothetical protein
METLKGELQFISLWHPIKLIEVDGKETDLRNTCWKVFTALNGCPASMKNAMNEIEVSEDLESKRIMEFEMKDGGILIALTEGSIGFSNVSAYLSDMLERLNSMQIIVTVGEKSIKFEHDTTQSVHEVNYSDGNSCKLTDKEIHDVCKIGQGKDCCIFLSAGAKGFMCEKFNYMAVQFLDRYSKNDMNAGRIGNCKIVGRKEE